MNHEIQKVLLIKKFSIAVVLCYNPNCALFVNTKSGEIVSQQDFDMDIPSCITYIESLETLIIGTNHIENCTSKTNTFKLINSEGILGFHDLQSMDISGALMDIQSFERV